MADRAEDDEYLGALIPAVRLALDNFQPDILFYVGGADPYCEDQLGGLSLTKEGLKQRDGKVFEEARRRRIPVATTLAGGYARRADDTARIHVHTILAAREVAEKYPQVSMKSTQGSKHSGVGLPPGDAALTGASSLRPAPASF